MATPIQTQVAVPVSDLIKSQTANVAEGVIIGPLLIYAGWTLADYKLDKINRPLGYTLMALGLGTVLLKGYNFLNTQKRIAQI